MIMLLRSLTIASVLLALLGCSPAGSPRAVAQDSPQKPHSPEQIDPTPPLIPIPNARVTQSGLLVGGQPSLTQLKEIQEAGYRTVVNLRPPSEPGDEGEPAAVRRLGMKYVSIPVPGAVGLTEQNARALAKAVQGRDALPAVVHCSTGQRVAALLGLKAFVVDRLSATASIDLAKGLGLTTLEADLKKRIKAICKRDKSRNCEDLR
jgi:protein tyrosine phosphatase (PTP) superfamily phosphohydrolase (DUF442 family)